MFTKFPALGKKLGGKMGKLGAVVEKKIMPVETDANKLVNFVCGSNINIKGEDVKVRSTLDRYTSVMMTKKNFQLKPDSEYPDWLWSLHTGPPKKLEELDPETKEYWRKLRSMALRRNNQLQKIKKF